MAVDAQAERKGDEDHEVAQLFLFSPSATTSSTPFLFFISAISLSLIAPYHRSKDHGCVILTALLLRLV